MATVDVVMAAVDVVMAVVDVVMAAVDVVMRCGVESRSNDDQKISNSCKIDNHFYHNEFPLN